MVAGSCCFSHEELAKAVEALCFLHLLWILHGRSAKEAGSSPGADKTGEGVRNLQNTADVPLCKVPNP